ncbi:MAG: transposase [SAR324 cluster bacterium]|nr:transposase [SAR324 cluster bacterium]
MVHSFTNKLGTRATRRHHPRIAEDEEGLTRAIVRLAERFGRYGCRRITAMLHREGWQVNHKRVERIWRKEGLKVPRKQPQFIIEQWRKEQPDQATQFAWIQVPSPGNRGALEGPGRGS